MLRKVRLLAAAVAVALTAALITAAGSHAGPIQALTMKIPDTGTSGPAYPYPSPHAATGLQGVVSDVNVTIPKLSHTRAEDLEMLLVGPQGQKVILTSDACAVPVAGVKWTFDDEATAVLDDFGTRACATGSYRPADLFDRDVLPAPAPAGPYATTLSAFDGTDPNGEWKLYVADDADGESGGVGNEFWSVQVETRPRAEVAFASGAVDVAEGQSGTLTLRRSATGGLGAGSVTVTSSAATATAGSDFEPVSAVVDFAPGQAERTIPVTALADAESEGAETFAVSAGSPTGDAVVGAPATATVTIPAQAGSDTNGGGGSQGAVLRCGGKRATIVGTEKRDVLRGTKRADVIVALGGNDVVKGGAGDDVICGGPGNDRLAGDKGKDIVFGEGGRDRLTGGAGMDRLVGGDGRDTCVVGKPRDSARCELRR